MTHPIERASVEQADVDLAKRIVREWRPNGYPAKEAEIARSLSAHRQQARDAGFAEGIERAAKLLDSFVTPYGRTGSAPDAIEGQVYKLAARVRTLSAEANLAQPEAARVGEDIAEGRCDG